MQDGAPTVTRDLLQRWRLEVLRLLQQRRQLSAALGTAQEAAAVAQAKQLQARDTLRTPTPDLHAKSQHSRRWLDARRSVAALHPGSPQPQRACERGRAATLTCTSSAMCTGLQPVRAAAIEPSQVLVSDEFVAYSPQADHVAEEQSIAWAEREVHMSNALASSAASVMDMEQAVSTADR